MGGKHTAKNVMVTAVKLQRRRPRAERARLRAQIRALCDEFGIETQALAAWMGEAAAPRLAASAPLPPPGERSATAAAKPARRTPPRTAA